MESAERRRRKGIELALAERGRDSNHVMKNNGTELDGNTIMEKDKNIAPTIYINSLYDRYREGVSLKAVVSEIIRIYNQNKNSININADYFENYENQLLLKAQLVLLYQFLQIPHLLLLLLLDLSVLDIQL